MSTLTASRIFRWAGIYGVLLLVPMYFLERRIGEDLPPAITHPEYYYGFLGVTIAWQIVYLLIASEPLKYRAVMLIAVFAKSTYAVSVAVLYALGRVAPLALVFGGIDLLFGILFLMCFVGLSKQVPASNGQEGSF